MAGQSDYRSENLWALILAGGDGTRLRDLTRAIAGTPIPKQYCRLLGNRSLLEVTLERVRSFAPCQQTLVVLNKNHIDIGLEQVRTLPPENILVQPCNRDTGPGLLFSLLHLGRRDPHGTVAIFPSDHYIGNEEAFLRSAENAVRAATLFPRRIVIIGIRPERADPGFGYIEPGKPLTLGAESPCVYEVRTFYEKPAAEAAERLIAQGSLWNSFVMVARVSGLLDLLRSLMPSEFAHMQAVYADPTASAQLYSNLPPWNFSNRLLARVPESLAVVPAEDLNWSDWGTPEAVYRSLLRLDIPPPWLFEQREPDAATDSPSEKACEHGRAERAARKTSRNRDKFACSG